MDNSKPNGIGTWLTRIYMILFSITIIFPLVWVLYSSLKTNQEFFQDVWALPAIPQFENYVRAWEKASIGQYFVNSAIITFFVVIIVGVMSSMCTYACTRLGLKLGGPVVTLFMAGLYIPTVLCLVPIYVCMKNLGLVNSKLGLTVLYIASNLPFSVFILSGFYKTVPKDLEEAAYIDGCGYFATYAQVILPITKPAMATVSIFTFMGSWNEYVLANMLVSKPENNTLPVGIVSLQAAMEHVSDWTALLAGIAILFIPMIIMYIFCQKYITSGMTAGALKG